MNTRSMVVGLGWILGLAGCASHPHIALTHREDMSAQSRVVAIAAHNLEDSVSRQRAAAAEEQAARAVAKFHEAAENFARAAGIWRDDTQVDQAFERLIKAHVEMARRFPDLHPDGLTREVYQKTEHEWERLRRAAGYAGERYQENMERKER